MIQDHARHLRSIILKATTSLSDSDALEAVELFPHYEVGVEYKRDDRFCCSAWWRIWRCRQTDPHRRAPS